MKIQIQSPLNKVWQLDGLFYDQTIICLATPTVMASIDCLYSEERALVRKAIIKRQREFAAGRLLSKIIPQNFGYRYFPLLKDEVGVPLWPVSAIGSISHCNEFCVVALVENKETGLIGLGVDIEPLAPLEADLLPLIANQNEVSNFPAHRSILKFKHASYSV